MPVTDWTVTAWAASGYNLAAVPGTGDWEAGAASLHVFNGTLFDRAFASHDCVEQRNFYFGDVVTLQIK